MRTVAISSQQIEEIVVSTHDLRSETRSAISSRLRYLQRMGFPIPAGTGRGRRLEYGLEDALKLLVAFHYLEWSLSPVRAMRTVIMNWPDIARSLVTSWRIGRLRTAGDHQGAAQLRHVMVVAPTALADVSDDPGRLDDQSPESIGLMRPGELAAWAEEADDDGDAPALLVLDPARLVSRISAAITKVNGAYDFEMDAAFRAMGAEAFGDADEKGWRVTS